MEFSYTIMNQDKLINAINRAPKMVLNEIRLAGKISARDIQRDARSKHRFTTRSGALEKSIATESNDKRLIWKIGIDRGVAEYGTYVHDGWVSRIKAKRGKKARKSARKPDPFIVSAGKKNIGHVNKLFARAISRALKKAFK